MPSYVKNPKMASKRITWMDSLKLPSIDEPPVLPMILNRLKKITFDDETAPFSLSPQLPLLLRGANPPFLSRITNNITTNDDNENNNNNNNTDNQDQIDQGESDVKNNITN